MEYHVGMLPRNTPVAALQMRLGKYFEAHRKEQKFRADLAGAKLK